MNHPFPVFAVVGVVHPKLFIAERVLDELDPVEIEAVLIHELGHIAAWDNLKRLVMKACGDLLVVPVGRSLVEHWSETAERAADQYAVEQSGRLTALNLASALIKIARLVPDEPFPAMPAASYVLRVDESLAVRVRRLLSLADGGCSSTGDKDRFFLPVLGFIAAAIFIVAINDGLLQNVHDLSETLFAVLQ
jgi:Zn-dependent protease with chaperone function